MLPIDRLAKQESFCPRTGPWIVDGLKFWYIENGLVAEDGQDSELMNRLYALENKRMDSLCALEDAKAGLVLNG